MSKGILLGALLVKHIAGFTTTPQGGYLASSYLPHFTDFFFFFLIAGPIEYGSSWARDWIQATAVATPDPLTHAAGPGIKPTPLQQPEPLELGS